MLFQLRNDNVLFLWTTLMLAVAVQGFVPYSCSFTPPEGCTCAHPRRPQVTCQPEVPLTSFPEVTTTMSSIHTLNLAENSIQSIQEQVCRKCYNLRRLNLASNNMSDFQASAQDGLVWPAALQYLDLSNNAFSTMQSIAFLRRFIDLKVLKLHNNKLSYFSLQLNGMDMLPKLHELYLDNNPLVIMGIDSSTLRTLSVSLESSTNYAKLSSVAAENLSSMRFTSTSAEVVPKLDWTKSRHLRYFGLENANLSDRLLSDLQLQDSGNAEDGLRLLSLKDNSLTLKGSYFRVFARGVKGLEYLDLSFNEIEKIKENTFTGFLRLKTLLLNNNNINKVEWRFLHDLTHLRILDLRNNHITSTDGLAQFLTGMSHFHTLSIGNNPFECTCAISDLNDMIRRQRQGEFHFLDPVEIRHAIRCASPPAFGGHLVANANIGSC